MGRCRGRLTDRQRFSELGFHASWAEGLMLKALRIQNLAILPEVSMSFDDGLNVLTGETGAGKSILVDAITLLAGRRSSVDDVRSGESQAVVEGILEFGPNDSIWSLLSDAGLVVDGEELVIRRTVGADGRSRAFVNNAAWTVSGLSKLAPHWIDISGQHGQHLLLDEMAHTELLDRFGIESDLLNSYSNEFQEIRRIDQELKQLREDREKGARERDFLTFQLRELTEAKLVLGEDEELSSKHQRVAHAEKLARSAQAMEEAMSGENGAIAQVARTTSEVANASGMDSSLLPWSEELEELSAKLEEIGTRVSDYQKNLNFDPGEVESINERLSRLQSVIRKHGSIEKAISERDRMEKSLLNLEDSGHRESELLASRKKVEQRFVGLSGALTKARLAAGKRFGQQVTKELQLLGMPSAHLMISWVAMGSDVANVMIGQKWFGPKGEARARIDFAPNPGEGARPLASIASGGELSRVLLAIKGVAMEKSSIGSVTFLFDEVDSGIGGETAERVGIRLKALAASKKERQVLCVTHLAQIACYADIHHTVGKEVQEGRTSAHVTTLNAKARKEELARMIGGIEITKRTLDHAGELLRKGGGSRIGL